jgi:pimeloyl-ACP methyl ester carboxylesterase
MSFLSWLTDRLILQPTRHGLHVPQRKPLLFSHGAGELEVWVHRVGPDTRGVPDLYLLEFPGTASRAEHRTDFVEDCWSQRCVEIWAVNPPGYGNSSGTASLKKLPAMADRALAKVRQVAGEIPVIAAGSSLGSVSALYLAAHHKVEGVMVQNPPALREVILAQSGWWHVTWAKQLIAAQIPCELDSIANARRAAVPAVFVTAKQDRIVPARIQNQIISVYAGPLKVFSMPDADHDTPLTERDLEQLRSLASWLVQPSKGKLVPRVPRVE